MTTLTFTPWWDRAVCKGDDRFVADPKHGPINTERARARHICVAHCPVLHECLASAMKRPPNGTVQGGLVWEDWGKARPIRNQPHDTGCGPWCAKQRNLSSSPPPPPPPPLPLTPQQRFGRRLLELRRARGWTQTDLSVKTSVSRSAISRFETGDNSPTIATLVRLASAFGMTVMELTAGYELG